MTASNGSGQAYDATVASGPGPDPGLVVQLRAAVGEAQAALDGARAKVALLEQHLAGAHQAVAIAEADVEQATARLAEVS